MPSSSQSTEPIHSTQPKGHAKEISTKAITIATIATLLSTVLLVLDPKWAPLNIVFVLVTFICAAPLVKTGLTHPLHGARGYRVVASAAIIITSAAAIIGAFSLSSVSEAILALGTSAAITVLLVVDHRLSQMPRDVETEEHTPVTLPAMVERIERGAKKQVSLESLKVGNTIFLEQGAIIPADGVLIDGELQVEESAVSGTAVRLRKLPSSAVYAGSVVLAGRALCSVRTVGEETVLARIERARTTSTNASEHQIRNMRLHVTERLVVLTGSAVAVLSAGVWAYAFTGGATLPLIVGGLAAAGSVLIITAALVAALRLAKRPDPMRALVEAGIRVKDPNALARLRDADIIVFEKTGVLTTGSFAIEHVVSFKPYTQQQVLNIAAAVEASSEHPIARTIVGFARAHGAISLQRADDVQHDADGGVSAVVNGKKIFVGSAAFMKRKKVKVPKEASEHATAGHTVIFVGAAKESLGYVVVSDTPREETKTVMTALKKRYRVVLLSGDHEDAAHALAESLGMHETIADANTARKREILAKMKAQGKKVVLVSDDVRDADVSLRVVLASEDRTLTALEQADMTILGRDLTKFQVAVEASHAAEDAETRASVWTITGAVIFLPVAAVTGSVPIAAVSAAIVVASSLRASEKIV